ncbi:MAG: regulatory protein RecX [Clostridia bacterium]|nr:regulatory protein RecX [Clostridia bacterium]
MTVSVTSVSALNGGSEILLSVCISDGEHSEKRQLVLLSRQYAELRPEKGEISEERFDELSHAADICAAVKRGMNILGYGASSKKNMRLKLRSKGFSPEVSETAAEYLEELGYINEESDAEREAERCVGKYWGRRRIAAALYEKGYCEAAVRGAIDSLEAVDFEGRCVSLIEKKFRALPEDANGRKKLFAALLRYGYSPSEIKNAFYIIESGE